MKNDEVNKVIAECMGEDGYCFSQVGIIPKNFHVSLDALVPVWERLGSEFKIEYNYDNKRYIVTFFKQCKSSPCIAHVNANTIQEAAAHATAKAILALEEK